MIVTRSLLSALAATLLATSALAQTRYTFTHLAGSKGGIGYRDAQGSNARFYEPTAVAVDGNGNVYVSDYGNHVLRVIAPDGTVTTLAGLAREMSYADGQGARARFHCPYGPAVGRDNTIFLSDSDNHVIRGISLAGVTTTIAGDPEAAGASDGSGRAARFDEPYGMAVDASGNIIVADSENDTIRRVTTSGVVTTIAGSAGESGYADGIGSNARFDHPTDVAVGTDGTIYVADQNNALIRRIAPDGFVSTFAGTPHDQSEADGAATAAKFNQPMGVATDAAGNIYVADAGGNTIRKIDRNANVTTLAGLAGVPGAADGTGSAARFRFPTDVAVDPRNGNVIVADSVNDTVRVVTPAGVVSTLAGAAAEAGFADGRATSARFDDPLGIAVDAGGRIAVSDSNNHVIRTLTFDGDVSTFAGAPRQRGSADGIGAAARFNFPAQLAFDASGNLVVADYGNHKIRRVAPDANVTTVAGTGSSGFADGPALAAKFFFPTAVAIGPKTGDTYVADRNNHVVRRIAGGIVTTVAGEAGVSGSNDGLGTAAHFSFPYGIAADSDENLYVADFGNHAIRKIASDGTVTTLAGSKGDPGFADGRGDVARFTFPAAVAAGPDNMLYVADSGSNAIRTVSPDGDVVTIGGGQVGSTDGTGTYAEFAQPYAIAVTADATLLIADRANQAIRIGTHAAPDTAAIDASGGPVGATRQLSVKNATATRYEWTIVRRPTGSVAPLDNPQSATPRFTPDAADRFIFELKASGPQGTSITTVTLDTFKPFRRRAVQ